MTKLYVGNLSDETSEKEVKEVFQAFGELEEVAVLRGYGFVVSEYKKLNSYLLTCFSLFPALCTL